MDTLLLEVVVIEVDRDLAVAHPRAEVPEVEDIRVVALVGRDLAVEHR